MSEEKKSNDKLFIAGTVVVCLVAAFVMVRLEVVKRAKTEYLEGERQLGFYRDPVKKKSHYDKLLADKKISAEEHDFLMEDNSLKNAYVQYQTVIDLFTPPESKWVKLSRERMKEIEPEYKAWVDELKKGSKRSK